MGNLRDFFDKAGITLDTIFYYVKKQLYLDLVHPVNGVLFNIDPVAVAKWMGHTLQEHWDSYLNYFEKNHHKQVWEKVFREDLGKDKM